MCERETEGVGADLGVEVSAADGQAPEPEARPAFGFSIQGTGFWVSGFGISGLGRTSERPSPGFRVSCFVCGV